MLNFVKLGFKTKKKRLIISNLDNSKQRTSWQMSGKLISGALFSKLSLKSKLISYYKKYKLFFLTSTELISGTKEVRNPNKIF